MIVGAVGVAKGIGAAVRASNRFSVVYDLPAAQVETNSVTVLPTGGSPDSPCSAALTFDLEAVAAPSDWATAFGWLTDAVGWIADALSADPSCGGSCSGVSVASWGQVFLTSIGGGADALAIRVTLTPTNATGA